VVVVGDPEGVEARLLRPLGLLDEVARTELLAGEKATDLHGAPLPTTSKPASILETSSRPIDAV
jgi:hypothetical protein